MSRLPQSSGFSGTALSPTERAFFRDADPLGFILFARNCATPDQVRGLVAELRGAVGRGAAPVLIDQEGGRVARLGPPHWRSYPSARAIAALGEAKRRGSARGSSPTISRSSASPSIACRCSICRLRMPTR